MSDSQRVLGKEPCPKCGSKDNLVRWQDGHAKCFSTTCDYREPPWNGAERTPNDVPRRSRAVTGLLEPDDKSFLPLPKRGLTEATLRRFGYAAVPFKGERVQAAPYYNQAGELALQKLRFKDKSFVTIKADDNAPPLSAAWLYGRHVWGDKHDKQVVITTGEIDAMSAAQATNFKFPCVSVSSGDQSAEECLKANYRWLDRFQRIVLLFDNDSSGQSAVRKCVNLFEPGKVAIAQLPGNFKDASDALQANRPGDIEQAIYTASVIRPKGIVNAAACASDFEEEDQTIAAWPWPWKCMQEKTLGIARGEAVLLVSGTGSGKTALISQAVHNWITEDYEDGPAKVGFMSFEADRKTAQLGIMSVRAGRVLTLDPLSKAETIALHKEVFGSGRCELFDPENAEWGLEAILGYQRYMAKALDCGLVVTDPLSFIMAGMDVSNNPVGELDRAAQNLAQNAKQLHIASLVSHHLARPRDGKAHEEGGVISLAHIRGSHGINAFMSAVIGAERDQQGARPDLMRLRSLKNRRGRFTGIMGILKYNPVTGCYEDTDESWPSDKDDDKAGFGPVTEY